MRHNCIITLNGIFARIQRAQKILLLTDNLSLPLHDYVTYSHRIPRTAERTENGRKSDNGRTLKEKFVRDRERLSEHFGRVLDGGKFFCDGGGQDRM